MNKHLEPVFKILLAGIEVAAMDYWVYGGIGVAACVGKFIRRNKDVDIFVNDNDYEIVKSILAGLCNKYNFTQIEHPKSKNNPRPKLDIKIEGRERLSVIPVYQNNDVVLFKYPKGHDESYSDQILTRIKRNVSGFSFFTPPNECIKKLFINHINARPDKKGRLDMIKDAKAILNSEELAILDWVID